MPDDDDGFDFDEIDFEGEYGLADTPDSCPAYRATVVGRRVTVIPWMPGLVTAGPMSAMLWERERAGVTIADLTRVEPPARELVARVLARGGGRVAERALIRWAGAVGYERLWLEDRVVALEPRVGRARTTCTNCGAEYREHTAEFWEAARQVGMFPAWCPLCGGDMPQWVIRR